MVEVEAVGAEGILGPAVSALAIVDLRMEVEGAMGVEEAILDKAGGEVEVLLGCIFIRTGRMGSLWIAVSIRRQRGMGDLEV